MSRLQVPNGMLLNPVPAGGTVGQILAKTSGTDYAMGWAAPFTQTLADARYIQIGAGGDPLPQYLTPAEGNAAYQTPAQAAALYLPLTGGTLTGNLLFSTDNTRDIGASGATRPRNLYLAGSATIPTVLVGSSVQLPGNTALATLNFSTSSNTGVHSPVANQVAISAAGVVKLLVTSTDITVSDALGVGTAAIPATTAMLVKGTTADSAKYGFIAQNSVGGNTFLVRNDGALLDSAGARILSAGMGGAMRLIASVTQVVSFSMTTVGAWTAVPGLTTGTFTPHASDTVLMMLSVGLAHSVASASMYAGFSLDGATPTYFAHAHEPLVGAFTQLALQAVLTGLSVSGHSIGIQILSNTAGTITVNPNGHNSLTVYEVNVA